MAGFSAVRFTRLDGPLLNSLVEGRELETKGLVIIGQASELDWSLWGFAASEGHSSN